MRLYPVLVDNRPSYLAGSTRSLLLMPLGAGTVLGRLTDEMARHTRHRLAVVTPFEPEPEYLEALAAVGVRAADVYSEAAFAERLAAFEPSDWLLIRDARRIAARPLDLSGLVTSGLESSHSSRHLVCRAGASAGTNERILLDSTGRVARIQRYYENVTWPFSDGVAGSLVPLAGFVGSKQLPVSRLGELRARLAASGVPSTDVTFDAALFDLGTESGFLAANEALVAAGPAPAVPASARIDPEAQIRGAVVVGEGASVEGGAVVIGPCVLGRDSRVGSGAVVAQCVLTPGSAVPAGEVARQRVVTGPIWGPRPVEAVFEPSGAGDLSVPAPLGRQPSLPAGSAVQRLAEAVLCFVALLLLSPLLALIALLVKLDSKGPIFFGHLREGRFARTFRCWKFRTMEIDADVAQQELAAANQLDGPQFKIHRDPRVTRVGRWLRRLNLDELPQLANVVTGEMSLVGPRPSPFRENQLCIPWREARLSVRPGITGLWQVCRHDRSSGDFHQWIYFDLLYVQHMSFWLDVKILVATLTSLGGQIPVPLSKLLPPSTFHDRRQPSRPPEAAGLAYLRRTA